MTSREINFDGLVGPTHNYGGLSLGNLASMNNLGGASNPRAAALQGLQKMRTLISLGLPQGVLLPHDRPDTQILRQFGFTGTDAQVLDTAWRTSPSLLINCASASPMWTANAATVSPSPDTKDGRVHFTAANLGSMFHRSIETDFTSQMLRAIFSDERHFSHHTPIPFGGVMGDEGAANHGRLAKSHGKKGIELFVYGCEAFAPRADAQHFPPRQALEASTAIAQAHQLAANHTVYVRQSTTAINAGAFHNDVVSVTNGQVLLYHEAAFASKNKALADISQACEKIEIDPIFIEVPSAQVSLQDAVSSYLFNSQLVTLADNNMALILPKNAQDNPHTHQFVEQCLAGNTPINSAHYLDLKQSMKNGGGPACLRLRVVMTPDQLAALSQTCLLDIARVDTLETWVKKHYRDMLRPDDLRDPQLLDQNRTALDTLTGLLGLGSLYNFQR